MTSQHKRKSKNCNCILKNMVQAIGDGTCPNCGGKQKTLSDETVEDRIKGCIKELEKKGTLDGVKITEKDKVLLMFQFCLWGIT